MVREMDNQEKIFVTKSSMPSFDEYVEEIRGLWDTRWLTNMGEKHRQFQTQLEKYLHAPHIELVVNGHMALELTLQAMHLEGEVITTPFTFASTTHAIVRNGLTPVFCDIRPDDYTIDADKIEALITDKTCAILPVHVYGNVCDVERIDEIAKKHGLKVVYDAAHAFGVTYRGAGIATYGDASIFSFHATKLFHSIEGGAVSYHDVSLGEELYRLKNFGIRDEETVDGVGANAKMNEFCAAMGICNLRHVEDDIAARKEIAERYDELLKDIPGVQLNTRRKDASANYGYYPIVIDETKFGRDRNEVVAALREQNIFCRKYFYPLTSMFDCYQDQFKATKTPIARQISVDIMTLPIYPELPEPIIDKICSIISGNEKIGK